MVRGSIAGVDMATDFDTPPFYDELTKDLINKTPPVWMSPIWIAWIESFVQTLEGYLTSHGVYIPRLTTAQRNAITTPSEGQMIYNITLLAPQIWQSGAWKTFTTT
jgi:hypothetical protein